MTGASDVTGASDLISDGWVEPDVWRSALCCLWCTRFNCHLYYLLTSDFWGKSQIQPIWVSSVSVDLTTKPLGKGGTPGRRGVPWGMRKGAVPLGTTKIMSDAQGMLAFGLGSRVRQ
jgi:hypothetical protein